MFRPPVVEVVHVGRSYDSGMGKYHSRMRRGFDGVLRGHSYSALAPEAQRNMNQPAGLGLQTLWDGFDTRGVRFSTPGLLESSRFREGSLI